MRSLVASLCALVLFSATGSAAEWNGFPREDFTVAEKPCLLVRPTEPAEGRPWIWRTEFFGHEPQADIALLQKGWHVAYMKVSDLYGAPPAIELMAKFHAHVVSTHSLNQRAVLEGFSRGGLYAVNFAAAHPDKTAALYLDAPVLDLRSWPGGQGKGKGAPALWKQALPLYGLDDESAKASKAFPIDQAERLAAAKIPIVSVCGDADDVVPYDENTGAFRVRYEKAGGLIEVILKPGVGHHPHSLQDPQPIVDFLLKNWRR